MKKKSFLLIGMGKFGHFLCRDLANLGHDVMIADSSEEKLSDLLDFAVSAKIGNCARREVLLTFGVEDFDACVVCISDDFQSSLEITDLLSDMGAKRVLSVAATETQAKFLKRSGADAIIFPERDIAERVAVSIGNDSIFDYFELSEEFSLYEITPPEKWLGRSIGEIGVRAKHRVSIIAYRGADGVMHMPGPDYRFDGREHIVVVGENADVNRIIGR